MRSTQRVTGFFLGSLLAAWGTISTLAQTATSSFVFSSTPALDHVRMQPFSINSAASVDVNAVLDFPAGATSSRASYDLDRGAAMFSRSRAASTNASQNSAASQNHGDSRSNHRQGGVRGLITVPTFQGAFFSSAPASFPNGASLVPFPLNEFPFFMMGNDPSDGGTTSMPAKIVTISLNLHDANGGVTSVPFAPLEQLALHSPNFEEADYTSGKHVQFADAVQRAEFFNNMQEDWHTVLRPQIVDRVTLDIPPTVRVRFPDGSIKTVPAYVIKTAKNGTQFILLLDLVFNATFIPVAINEINSGAYTRDAVNMELVFNTSLFSLNAQGGVGDCCVGGFHTFANDDATPQSRWIFAFAGWDPPGIFRGGVADVTSMSHEISEAFNDPFVDNIVPTWQFPGLTPGTCQGNLETGDPVEVLANSVFPVRIKDDGINFVFHPQTEALLQWFEQGLPSDALGGAFSYPDTTSLTTAAQACPPPPKM